MNDDASYYIVIPAPVRQDKSLSPCAILLYGEIAAKCNAKGFCWATNQFFADIFRCNIRSIQRYLKELEFSKHIVFELDRNDEGTERRIFLCGHLKYPYDTTVMGAGDTDVTKPYDTTVMGAGDTDVTHNTLTNTNTLTKDYTLNSKLIVNAQNRAVSANAEAQSLFNLKRDYENLLNKDKTAIYDFIKNFTPGFIEPYVDYWNLFAETKLLPQVIKINDVRKRKFANRIKDKDFNFLRILYKANHAGFIMNGEGKWFTFDWIIENESNYLKVIEGNYENREKPTSHANQSDKQRIEREKAEQRTAELINQR